MMNGVPEIVRYSSEYCSLDELVSMHILISSGTKISDFLIYKDPNFGYFLKEFVLKSAKEHVYLLINEEKTIGFCRLRVLHDTLFLNNIFIKDEFRGKGFGKDFLVGSIRNSLDHHKVEFLSLDVFLSNTIAYQWYVKIGMETIGEKHWCRLHPEKEFSINDGIELAYKPDCHGFMAAYVDKLKVGSFINNHLVVSNLHSLSYFGSKDLSGAFIKTSGEVNKTYNCLFEELEISCTMKGELTQVLPYLEK